MPPFADIKEDLWSLRKRRNRPATAAVVVSAESRTPAADEVSKAAAKRLAAEVELKAAGSQVAEKRAGKAVRLLGKLSF